MPETNETIIPDNAGEIFEPEPDTRTDQEKMIDGLLEDVPDELRGYLKAAAKIMLPSCSPAPGMTGMIFKSPVTENKVILLSLRNDDLAVQSAVVVEGLLMDGYSFGPTSVLQFDGRFLVVFWREKRPDLKVPEA